MGHECTCQCKCLGAHFFSGHTVNDYLMFIVCRRFLTSLEDSDCDAVRVAQCFVDQFDEFIIYAEYCTNYPRSVYSSDVNIPNVDS